jgi:hypothetical protein
METIRSSATSVNTVHGVTSQKTAFFNSEIDFTEKECEGVDLIHAV